MKSEFALAFNEITERFSLPQDTVMEALEAAMASAYRRSVNASSAQAIEVKIDPGSGGMRVYAEKEVVEEVENPATEVLLDHAREFDPEAELGSVVLVESTPEDFGRVDAQTAKQVLLQRLREAEREAQYAEFIEREGDMVHGTVHSITPQSVMVGLLGRAEAILPRNQQIPGERFRVRDRIRVYVREVRKSSRGPVIVVSRTHPNMLRRLLEMEVPEINQGLVEIKAIAREAGKRAKVAVAALREGVDPVGACVGLRGVRIQSVVRDLNDEKIDVIEWNPDVPTFIAKALSPARVSGVYLEENPERGRTAMVVVPEDQLSLAIGRAGVNARLAAKLTGWRIDIKSRPEAAADSLRLLAEDESFAELAEQEAEVVPEVEAILGKKAEGRPVTPEEYQVLTGFVDRVHGEIMARREAERQREMAVIEAVRDEIPDTAYETKLEEVGLSTRVENLLTDAGYETAGKVLEQLELDEQVLEDLQGVGPKSIEEMREVLDAYPYPEPEVEAPEAEVEEEVEPEAEAEPEAAPLEVEEAIPALAEAVKEAPAEEEAPIPEPVMEAEAVDEPEAEEEEEELEEVEETFEALLEKFDTPYVEDEELEEVLEEEEEDDEEAEERKRRKRASRVIEYDPELGETVVKRRRKRDSDEWEEYGF